MLKNLHMLILLPMVATMPFALAQQPVFPWLRSYDSARAQSKKAVKPILIYFTTTWCGYCKVMEKETFPSAAVIEQSRRYTPVKLDAEKEGKALAGRFGVNSYPTFVLLGPDEKVLGEIVGFKTAAEFTARVDQILAQDSTMARLLRVLKANPRDGKANSEMAIQLLGDGKDVDALKHIEVAQASGFRGKELARALTDYGKQFVRVDWSKSSKYLEQAIELKAPDSSGDAYENLMLSALYANKPNEAKSVARRIVGSPGLTPAIKAKADTYIKSREYTPKLQTPKGLLDQLVLQLQGHEGRDNFYFTSLFLKDAVFTTITRSEQLGILRVDHDVQTWIETSGPDKLKEKLTETSRELTTKDNVAYAWLEFDGEQTLPTGEKQRFKNTLSVTMMVNGDRWHIVSLIRQARL